MKDKTFGTCLNCMDGRVQFPAIQWIKDNYSVDFVDMITEAGIDGLLANPDSDIQALIQKINISTQKHGSEIIGIVGHCDCVGNQVDAETHKNHVRSAVQRVSVLFPQVKTVGLMVSEKLMCNPVYEV